MKIALCTDGTMCEHKGRCGVCMKNTTPCILRIATDTISTIKCSNCEDRFKCWTNKIVY